MSRSKMFPALIIPESPHPLAPMSRSELSLWTESDPKTDRLACQDCNV